MGGVLGGDFGYEYSASISSIFVAILLVLFTFFFTLKVLYPLINSIKIPSISLDYQKLSYPALLVLAFGFYSAIFYQIGVAGLGDLANNNENQSARQLYALLQPAVLVLAYIFIYSNIRGPLYYLIVAFYVAYCLIAGQTGQLLTLFVLYIYCSSNREQLSFKLKVIFLTALGLAVYPFVRILKNAVIMQYVSGTSFFESVKSLLGSNLLNTYHTYLIQSFERFQVVANLSYLMENFRSLYVSTELHVIDFFNTNWIFNTIGSRTIVTRDLVDSPQSMLAFHINNVEGWNSHIGLFGYAFAYGVSGFLIVIFSILLMVIAILLSNFIDPSGKLRLLTWISILKLICFGWINAFINYIQALLILAIIMFCMHILMSLLPSKQADTA
ncbi:hypothetical protein CWE13_04995 [Aliidiomarina shirensis]|uniref:Oligosaccharide repeat unit polymerase n=1 Tax=Aliidiomarina shirensis TaxID=1048642 RepID=A0A432WU81_9GAMM|nr:hypothetical protein CWE13_04995 [Aliidiomarina shirensis]